MPRLLTICTLFFALSCGGSRNCLDLQITRHSAEILTCDKIFASNLKAIEERNEILLQTGSIDTTDEHQPIKSAIVTIGKNEVVMNLITARRLDAETTEHYQGNGYSLTLIYQSISSQHGKIIYRGNFILAHDKSQSKFVVEGKKCLL